MTGITNRIRDFLGMAVELDALEIKERYPEEVCRLMAEHGANMLATFDGMPDESAYDEVRARGVPLFTAEVGGLCYVGLRANKDSKFTRVTGEEKSMKKHPKKVVEMMMEHGANALAINLIPFDTHDYEELGSYGIPVFSTDHDGIYYVGLRAGAGTGMEGKA